MSTIQSPPTLRLRVIEAASRDVGRGLVRLDPVRYVQRWVFAQGDIVRIAGPKSAIGKALPAHREARGKSHAQIDGVLRESAGCGIDDFVEIQKITANDATSITVRPRKIRPS